MAYEGPAQFHFDLSDVLLALTVIQLALNDGPLVSIVSILFNADVDLGGTLSDEKHCLNVLRHRQLQVAMDLGYRSIHKDPSLCN
jgi:hypothetical protein